MTEQQDEPQIESEKVIRGVLQRVTFRNPDNGYCVLQLSLPEQKEQLTVVGTSLDLTPGSELIVRGTYKHHPKFGKQFSASSITSVQPTSASGIERYLCSGTIKGIGEKTAQRLIETFGEKTLEMLQNDPERAAKLSGIGKKKVALIQKVLIEEKQSTETLRFLLEHQITPNMARRIIERYGLKTVEIISRDPYILARQLRGVGFLTADTIARNLGIKSDAPQRIKAGLYHALEKASDDGHCFLKTEDLCRRARLLLALDDESDLPLSQLAALVEEGFVVRDGDAVYLRPLHRAEEFVAEFIAARVAPLAKPIIPSEEVERRLRDAGAELGLEFSMEQREAVIAATRQRLLLITGGPGCGKTTIIRGLAHLFRAFGKRLVLAAPTGRAAQRIAQVCSLPASTIHRLLKYDPMTGRFLHGVNDPLMADAVIVDEASMIDILLAKDLFSAVPKDAVLILVGDRDQLPSVGPGRVFADLVTVPKICTITLSRLFRRAEESSINTIAHMINSGLVPEIPQPDGVTKTDAYFLPRSDPEEASQMVVRLFSDQVPKKFGFALDEITVLTPSNRGLLGTLELNRRLQATLNPLTDREQEIEVGDAIFRVGDRVCQRVNNYRIDSHGVFNGDIGAITAVDRRTRALTVELWDGRLVRYEGSDLNQLSHAYAVTVHRSQGSEIPCVILALDDSHYTLLERQLIYTGVTRAKRLLIVVGSKRALTMATKRTSAHKRCTQLRQRILAQIDG